MFGLTFFSKFDWGSYTVSNARSASKKIGALICFMKFILRLLFTYRPASNIVVWVDAPTCHFGIIHKLQTHTQINSTVAPSLPASLETLAHC